MSAPDDAITAAGQRQATRQEPANSKLPLADAQISEEALRYLPQATDETDVLVYDAQGRMIGWSGPVLELSNER